MAYEHSIARYRRWYRTLLRFYAGPYRERFAESMEQTFADLCRERSEAGKGLVCFVLWMFLETSVAILRQKGVTMFKNSVHVFSLSGLAVVAIYVALVLGELLSMSNSYLYLYNEIGVSATLLRIGVLAITVLPVAFFAGRQLVLRLPTSGRTGLLVAAGGFALIIGLLQVFVYDWSVLGASLLKVAFASTGFFLVANRYRAVEH